MQPDRWRLLSLLDMSRWTIPKRLIAMVIAVALPLNIVVGIAIWHLARADDRSQRAGLLSTAKAVASGLDAKLGTYLAVAEGLSRSPALMAENVAGFAGEAERAFASLPDAWVLVSEPSGRELLNFGPPGVTRVPFRTAKGREIQQEAFQKRAIVISGVWKSERYRDWVIIIEVPLFNDGKPFRSLTIALKARGFSDLLEAQSGRPGMIIGIIDGDGRIVARLPDLESFMGVAATNGYRSVRRTESISDLVSLQGNEVVVANAVSTVSHWTVAVALDKAVLRASTWQTVGWSALSTGGISLASLMLALFMARQISRPLASMRLAASTLVDDDRPVSVGPPPEITELSVALQQAAAAREQALASLRASEARFRTIFETAQEGIWLLDRQGQTIQANPKLADLLGTTIAGLTSRPVDSFCFDEDQEECRQRLRANFDGDAQQFEFRFRRNDGKPVHVLAATAPLRGPGDEIVGALCGFLDLSERKLFEERQRLLMRELAHRGKNLLAVVQSIAGRTLTNTRAIDESKAIFLGRLHALANTYGTLVNEGFSGAPLAGIIAPELHPLGERAKMEGPSIMLTARAAQTMALIIHELATNASKYGAMSRASGTVKLRWSVDQGGAEPRFKLEWRETGGPQTKHPTRKGFGTALLTTVAEADLSAKTELIYGETGFAYTLEAPLSAIGTALEDSPVRKRLQSETMVAFYDAWASLKGGEGALPSLARFDRSRFAATGGLTIADIRKDGDVAFIEIGRALVERLGEVSVEDLIAETAEAHEEAYRRCAGGSSPCYEHLRFGFGTSDSLTFERLLVPFSNDGKRVSQIAGLVVFSGNTDSLRGGSTRGPVT